MWSSSAGLDVLRDDGRRHLAVVRNDLGDDVEGHPPAQELATGLLVDAAERLSDGRLVPVALGREAGERRLDDDPAVGRNERADGADGPFGRLEVRDAVHALDREAIEDGARERLVVEGTLEGVGHLAGGDLLSQVHSRVLVASLPLRSCLGSSESDRVTL